MVKALLTKRLFSARILSALFMGASVMAWLKIPLEITPQESTPSFLYVRVEARSDLTSPQTEALVTREVEGAVRTVPGIVAMSSRTSGKSVSVSLTLRPTVNLDLASVQLQEALLALSARGLVSPQGIQVSRFNPDSSPILRLAISDPSGTADLSSVIAEQIRPALESIPEVAKIEITGVEPRTLQQNFRLANLIGAGTDPMAVGQRLRATTLRDTIGLIRNPDTGSSVGVRAFLSLDSLASLESQILSKKSALRIQDLAPIQAMPAHEFSVTTLNGTESASIEVFLRDRANPFEFEAHWNSVMERVPNLSPEAGRLRLTEIMNRVDDLKAALSDVKSSLLQSILITFAVIWFFVRDARRTLLISATIPVTLLVTLLLMYGAGYTLNIITLSGLLLGVGMVVDNVILVVDRTLEFKSEGDSLTTAAARAASVAAPGLVLATLTNAVIFLPVAFLQSGDGFIDLLRAFQAPILATLIASLVVAILILPASMTWVPSALRTSSAAVEPGRRERKYFVWIFTHRKSFAALALVFLVFIGERVASIPQTDLEPPADPWANLHLKFDPSMPGEERRSRFDEVELLLLKSQDEVGFRVESGSFSPGSSTATFQLYPRDQSDADTELVGLQKRLESWVSMTRLQAGASLALSWESGSGSTVGAKFRRVFTFQGTTAAGLQSVLAQLRAEISPKDGTFEVLTEEQAFGVRDRLFEAYPGALAAAGTDFAEVAAQLSSILATVQIGPLEDAQKKAVSLRVRTLSRSQKWDEDAVLAIPIRLKSGKVTALRNLGSFRTSYRASGITRKDGSTTQRIAVDFPWGPTDPKSRAAISAIQSVISNFAFPPGFGPKQSDAATQLKTMQEQMVFMLGLSTLLIYLVLGASFHSVLTPFVVLFSIPSAILSGIFGLWICGFDLDVMGRLSLVLLVGIGVNNSILLIDLIEELRAKGLGRAEAIVSGCAVRFRAVVMTTAIQVIGVLPVAIGNSKIMGIPYSSLGVAIIFGMLISSAITLLALPYLYEVLSRWEERLSRSFSGSNSKATQDHQEESSLPLESAA